VTVPMIAIIFLHLNCFGSETLLLGKQEWILSESTGFL